MILVRLEFWAEKHQLLSPTQYGFRQGKGTRDCQALFATDIQIAFRSKQALTAVFLDIKGAYDSVLIDILCQKLCVLGIPARLAEFLFDLLSLKVMHFFQNFQIKHVRNSFSGLTQGSSLSPLLYNLYTRDIDNCIESGCVLVQYADDACLWASAKDVKLSKRPLQICLNKLTTWASDLGLEFSASKTEFVIFSNKRLLSPVQFHMYGVQLSQSLSYMYLGLWFASKCTWKVHVQYVVRKCQRRIHFLRTIAGTWWGAHPSDMIKLYKTTILSVIEYGSFVFHMTAKTHFIKLERIQFRCLRICLGLLNSTHTQSVEVIAGVIPLNIRFFELNCRYLTSSHVASTQFMTQLDELFRIHPQSSFLRSYRECLVLPTSPCLDNFYGYNVPARPCQLNVNTSLVQNLANLPKPLLPVQVKQSYMEALSNINADATFFTDGSLEANSCGFGVYNSNHQVCYQLETPCSIYTAELLAIKYTVDYIKTLAPRNYLICSDSLSSLEALKNIGVGLAYKGRSSESYKGPICYYIFVGTIAFWD
ncbi:probable RNA-directed DNA polymerase from transposon BS isoform X1 [Aedes albopictus]|uniref:Reverse transcriptase domain-containing protein n=1 Tax=Aedes albopictus TaxID=7160 RepID=A0ABM1YGM4_AEDAL